MLEEMASNNYHWASDRATTQRGGGKYSVDAVTLLASRVEALAQRFEKMSSHPSPSGSSRSTVEVYAICETCGVQGHMSAECYNGPPTIDHVNTFQGFQPPPQHPSHLTAYNQEEKSYSNRLYATPHPTSSEYHETTWASAPSGLYLSTTTSASTSTIYGPLGEHDGVIYSDPIQNQ